MTTVNVGKAQWAHYFATISAGLGGKQALVEVVGLRLGDQVEARWIPLLGVTYDHKDDIVVLDLGDLNHIIRHPTRVDAVAEGGAVSSIEIIDQEGLRHIARLREPLLLAKSG